MGSLRPAPYGDHPTETEGTPRSKLFIPHASINYDLDLYEEAVTGRLD